jgi:hypothetical protein
LPAGFAGNIFCNELLDFITKLQNRRYNVSSGIFFDVMDHASVTSAGGFDAGPMETMLDDYGLRSQGPADENDCVIINRRIDDRVRPVGCRRRNIPAGRIFSLTRLGDLGTMIPGVWDTDEYPVACMMIGSNSDDFDVLGGPPTGDPAAYMEAQVAMKVEANIPFWPLSSGYIFETSAFRAEDIPALAPTVTLTSVPSLTDFDIAGLLITGGVYIDHVIGVIVERPAPCGINSAIQTCRFIGETIPRIRKGTLALLRD